MGPKQKIPRLLLTDQHLPVDVPDAVTLQSVAFWPKVPNVCLLRDKQYLQYQSGDTVQQRLGPLSPSGLETCWLTVGRSGLRWGSCGCSGFLPQTKKHTAVNGRLPESVTRCDRLRGTDGPDVSSFL